MPNDTPRPEISVEVEATGTTRTGTAGAPPSHAEQQGMTGRSSIQGGGLLLRLRVGLGHAAYLVVTDNNSIPDGGAPSTEDYASAGTLVLVAVVLASATMICVPPYFLD